jgi:serine/threonine-protein kinase
MARPPRRRRGSAPAGAHRPAPPSGPKTAPRAAGRAAPPQAPATPSGARRPAPAQPAGAPPAAPKKDPLVGLRLGRCRLIERIGAGRTAVVYRARHEALDSDVAVKILTTETARNPELVQSFTTEARAIAKIDNENVLKIYDVGEQDGLHFSVMELLEGESVLDLVQREKRLDPTQAMSVARQAANGLMAAHERGIVHRDVKPQNLVLLEDGTVKVVDFGLAVGDEAAGRRVGTPHYMAPEVCEAGTVSPKNDVYGLGVTLYHMLVGQPPYAGQDIAGILRSHVKGEPLRPERARPGGLPRDVADLVRTLTLRNPDDRPDARAARERLDAVGGDTVAKKATLKRRKRAGRKRSSAVGTIVALVVVAGGIAAAVFLLGNREETSGNGGAETPVAAGPGETRPPTTTAVAPPIETPTAPTGPTPDELAAAQREKDGADALTAAEVWARETWRGKDETDAVVNRYRRVRDAHKGTAAGLEAERRAKEISAGRMHPHPDKQWTTAAEVEQARARWKEVEPRLEEMVAAHRYGEAKAMLPPPVQDASGELGKQLAFWHAFLDHLLQYRNALGTYAAKLPEEQRRIRTAGGEGTFVEATESRVAVRMDGTRKEIPWSEVPAAELARLGLDAFADAEPQHHLWTVAFAFAHRLGNEFWDASMAAEMSTKDPAIRTPLAEYKRRFDAWKKR